MYRLRTAETTVSDETFVSANETSGHAGGIVGNSGGGDTAGCDGGVIAGCVNFGKVRASGAAGIVYQAREGAQIKYCANRNEIAATMVAWKRSPASTACSNWHRYA